MKKIGIVIILAALCLGCTFAMRGSLGDPEPRPRPVVCKPAKP
jgi:hypothetical protein